MDAIEEASVYTSKFRPVEDYIKLIFIYLVVTILDYNYLLCTSHIFTNIMNNH